MYYIYVWDGRSEGMLWLEDKRKDYLSARIRFDELAVDEDELEYTDQEGNYFRYTCNQYGRYNRSVMCDEGESGIVLTQECNILKIREIVGTLFNFKSDRLPVNYDNYYETLSKDLV